MMSSIKLARCTVAWTCSNSVNALFARRGIHSSTHVIQARERLANVGSGAVTLSPWLPQSGTSSDERAMKPRVAMLTLDNPAKRNALSGRMMVELANHIETLGSDSRWSETTCLIVNGSDKFFCSGADLAAAGKEMSTPEAGLDMCYLMQNTLHNLSQLPMVSIAAIRGGAVGGGTELSLSCDRRCMESSAMFQMVHAKMGLSPGWGGATRLTKVVGRSRALEILIGGKRMTGEECKQAGLVDTIANTGEEFECALQQEVEMFSSSYYQSIQACKMAVAMGDLPVVEALSEEAQVFHNVWGGDANRDALSKLKSRSR